MKNIKISLMGWILIGLSLVGLLPFAITAYQIRASRDGLVEQVQQTHLVAVLSTADRIGSYLEILTAIANSAAKNPNLYQQPDSLSAQEILIGILRSRSDVVAASIIQNTDSNVALVQSAQSKENSSAAQEAFKIGSMDTYQLVKADQKNWLMITQPLGHSSLSVRLLAKRTAFSRLLLPKELEEADLGMFTREGVALAGLLGTLQNFPLSFQEQTAAKQIRSAADHFDFANGARGVASFAEVPNTDWIVVSRQPARKAEIATQQLLQQAFFAFGFVFVLAGLFALAAKRKVIKPIQELIKAQRQLAGIDLDMVQGSEIEQLKVSFARLEQNVSARKAVDKMFLGRYQVVEVIASGAMGTVFKGYDPRLERDVALKTIKIGELSEEYTRAKLAVQLVNEAKLVAKLPHPNIVTVYDAMDAGESALVAMEFIDGLSLLDYLREYAYMSPNQVIALAIGMLRGLGAAHKAGIIHRDIKPGNILLAYDGGIKLTDFGIADLLTRSKDNTTGLVVGTPGYIAPELLDGSPYSTCTDLFAMGVLLYRCATQTSPFKGRTLKSILQKTLTHTPLSPVELNSSIPTELSNAIMFLLHKDPETRPQDADVIADALEQEFGVVKWTPPDSPMGTTEISTSSSQSEDIPSQEDVKTRLLAETVIRKHMRNPE